MATCDVCGNDYDKCFTINAQKKTYTFDCFECAIQALAPACAHCKCKIIGHGVEDKNNFYCCAHCAHESGAYALKDRV